MRGLKRHRSARILAAGHAFVQNLRRGHYDIATEVPSCTGSAWHSTTSRSPSDPAEHPDRAPTLFRGRHNATAPSSKLPASFLVGVLAQEIGERGITVNAVIPTATDTAGYFTNTNTNTNDDDPLRPLVQNASPIGSRMGSVDDVADAVEFFTGKLARWISG